MNKNIDDHYHHEAVKLLRHFFFGKSNGGAGIVHIHDFYHGTVESHSAPAMVDFTSA
jgi:hypothetical protein